MSPFDMLVSGVPAFFAGGGISGSSVCGRYALSVIRGRLDDARTGLKELKGHRWALRHWEHRREAVG